MFTPNSYALPEPSGCGSGVRAGIAGGNKRHAWRARLALIVQHWRLGIQQQAGIIRTNTGSFTKPRPSTGVHRGKGSGVRPKTQEELVPKTEGKRNNTMLTAAQLCATGALPPACSSAPNLPRPSLSRRLRSHWRCGTLRWRCATHRCSCLSKFTSPKFANSTQSYHS